MMDNTPAKKCRKPPKNRHIRPPFSPFYLRKCLTNSGRYILSQGTEENSNAICRLFFLYRRRLVPGPNLGPAATNRDLRLYPDVYFSCIVTNLHLSVFKIKIFNHRPLTKVSQPLFFRFTNDILEKFLLTNSRHTRSGEMRRRLYYCHPKFGQVRLPTNAATNADFLNQI